MSPRAIAHLEPEPPAEAEEPLPFRAFTRRRMVWVLAVVLVVLLLVVVPPLLNVGRYRRQIASSIGQALGRPVRIDQVSLTLLPLPGFTLEGFSVGEKEPFGAEPVLRADEVRATLRVSSLWRRQLEFSRISLTDPSINVVHLPDGRWNFEEIFLQAARLPAAPTAQRTKSEAPRFPYIEATGARLNLKQGYEKKPFSLTEGDLALWLSEPGQWHLRVKAHPTRTDTAVSDTGVMRIEGQLGKAESLTEVPLSLRGDWTAAPLGAVSLILAGRDLGLRGTLDLHTELNGTAGLNHLSARLGYENLRRADFVPRHSLSGAVECGAELSHLMHTVRSAHCVWPGDAEGSGATVDFAVPDLRTIRETGLDGVDGRITAQSVPAGSLLDALRVVTNSISPDLFAAGSLSGTVTLPITSSVLMVRDATLQTADQPAFLHQTVSANVAAAADGSPVLLVAPVPLDLRGDKPASLTLQWGRPGLDLQLTGEAARGRLLELAHAIPPVGDGLADALPPANPASTNQIVRLDLTAHRGWFAGPVWQTATKPVPLVRHTRAVRRRHR